MAFIDIAGARLEYERIAARRNPHPPPSPASGRRDAAQRSSEPSPACGRGQGEGLSASAPPSIVILHEGLGSLAMWRDFPQRIAGATGAEVVTYSRRGYGQSDPRPGANAVDYMHREAIDVLPKLLAALGIERPILIGHSDGASIALIHAGSGQPVAGLVLMAPHVFVEDLTVDSIARIREVWQTTDMKARLGRYHRDVEHTFRGWNDIWLLPAFKQWNIEAVVPKIDAPMMIIQGLDDEYGTPAQCQSIRTHAQAPCELVLLEGCRHSPHRDQPERTLAAIARFVNSLADQQKASRAAG